LSVIHFLLESLIAWAYMAGFEAGSRNERLKKEMND
jgi:hypothetical protein